MTINVQVSTSAQQHDFVFASKVPFEPNYHVTVFGKVHVGVTRDEALNLAANYLCDGKTMIATDDFVQEAYKKAHIIGGSDDPECYFCDQEWEQLADIGEGASEVYAHGRIPVCKHCAAEIDEKKVLFK